MLNPILNKRKITIYYFVFWFIVAVIQFIVLFQGNKYNFLVSFADSFVYTIIFSVIGLILWFVVRYGSPKKNTFISLFLLHLFSLSISVICWIYISHYLLHEILLSFNQKPISFSENVSYRVFSGILYYTVISFTYYLFIYYNNLNERIRNEGKLESLIKEAELKAIKSQINPHFLFNSLNSISSLTISQPSLAQEMIINLSEYLRYSISHKDKQLSTLKTEIENCKKYLEIEKIRFGNKLQVTYDISDACLNCIVPTMILQPLYENAIKHGVYESSQTITINTLATCNNELLEIKINNNIDPDAILRKGEGFGIKSIKDRLAILYNDRNLLTTKRQNNVFEAKLLIPQKTINI